MTETEAQVYIDKLMGKFPKVYTDCVITNTHPVHTAYRLINTDAEKNGTHWDKCLDCGLPYVVGDAGSTTEFCSKACEDKTLNYLNGGGHHGA